MNAKEKTLEFWEEHKAAICFTAGVVVATVTIMAISKSKYVPGTHTWTPNPNPEFPIEMPLQEIKDTLSKVAGAVFHDALIVTRDGATKIFVRSAV